MSNFRPVVDFAQKYLPIYPASRGPSIFLDKSGRGPETIIIFKKLEILKFTEINLLQTGVFIQSNLHVQPPLVSDHLSKTSNFPVKVLQLKPLVNDQLS